MKSQKFLVQILEGMDKKTLFFGVWGFIVGFTVLVMWLQYRKTTRRNFRGPGEGDGPRVRVDARRLGASGSQSTQLTVKESNKALKK